MGRSYSSKDEMASVKSRSRPWFRQEAESIPAYEAFMLYLTMGRERNMAQVSRDLGKAENLIYRWSSRWRWQDRVAAYEEHFLTLNLDSYEAERERMWRRHRSLANEAMVLVEATFAGLREKIDTEGRLDAIKPDALVRLMAEAAKLDRMAVLGQIEAHAKSAEERERLIERYGEELANTMKELMGDVQLTPEQQQKFQDALQRHVIEAGEQAMERAMSDG